ncbi:MAG: histidine kinase [Acidobacteriota bacterium]
MISNHWKTRLSSFWTLQIIGWSIYAVMIYITFLTVVSTDRMFRLFQIKSFRAIVGFALTCILRLIYKRFSSRRDFQIIAVLVIINAIVFGSMWTLIEFGYYWLTEANFSFVREFQSFPKVTLDYAVTLLAWSALYFGIKYWQAWQEERERTLAANALAHQAQLDMLRYQLNPHFLFNALNSIRASIDEDSRRAKRMITEFSEFLRYSLLQSNSSNITLGEELEAIKNYLAIEKIRFEDKLDYTFDIEADAEAYQLPAFLIHPLVENAIKHGMTNQASPLRIQIKARLQGDGLWVEVANTGKWNAATIESNGTGIGLKNIRQRLEQLFPGRSALKIHEREGWIHAAIEIKNQQE